MAQNQTIGREAIDSIFILSEPFIGTFRRRKNCSMKRDTIIFGDMFVELFTVLLGDKQPKPLSWVFVGKKPPLQE